MSEASPPVTPPPAGAGSRRLKYVLIASLALNLLIIGLVAGTMSGFGKHRRTFFGHRGEDFGLMGLSRHMPDERKKEFRKKLRDDRQKLRPLINDVRSARREAAHKLAAEPFDRASLESAFGVAGDKDRTLRQAAIAAFLARAEQLTLEERRMLAEWWLKKNESYKGRKAKKKDEQARGASPQTEAPK